MGGSGGGLSAATWPLPAQQPPGTRGTSQTKDRAGQARAEGAGPPGSEGSRPRTSPGEDGAEQGGPRGAEWEPGTQRPHFPAGQSAPSQVQQLCGHRR